MIGECEMIDLKDVRRTHNGRIINLVGDNGDIYIFKINTHFFKRYGIKTGLYLAYIIAGDLYA
jgi:hypothetical protein